MRALRWVSPLVVKTATAAISGTGTFTATGMFTPVDNQICTRIWVGLRPVIL